jgi:hypothetical protein
MVIVLVFMLGPLGDLDVTLSPHEPISTVGTLIGFTGSAGRHEVLGVIVE